MKIAVFGAKGRVGSRVCALAKNHTIIPLEKGEQCNIGADVCIDFSLPDATETVCDYCKTFHCPLVTGVTGRNDSQLTQIAQLQQIVPVVAKANFSVGVEMLHAICALLAPLGWDCEIVETHRKNKKDSPSGTARELSTTLLKNGVRKVVVHALRCGSNFGQHQIVFATEGESITVTHQAENVDIFALGALITAENLLKNSANIPVCDSGQDTIIH